MKSEIRAVRTYLVDTQTGWGVNNLTADKEPVSPGWLEQTLLVNPMSIYPTFKNTRESWRGPARDAIVVELETRDGTVGSAVTYGGGPYACALIEDHLSLFLRGADARDVERIWDQMYRASLPYGRRGLGPMAISAVDKALWDLLGHIYNEPVYNLIGGRTREVVTVYATGNSLDQTSNYGFPGYKIHLPYGPADGREGLKENLARVQAAREIIGDNVDLMVECYMGWNREYAVRFAQAAWEYDVRWLEDPLLPDDLEGYRQIRERVKPIQIAVGNMEAGRHIFKELIVSGACDIIQPAVEWAGGITEVRKIAALAAAFDVPVFPHCDSVYAYHLAMGTPNCVWGEFIFARGDGTKLLSSRPAITNEPLPQNGQVYLREDPGFGVDIDRRALREWREHFRTLNNHEQHDARECPDE